MCSTWKKALSGLPIAYIELLGGETEKELCNWLIQHQPTVVSLCLYSSEVARDMAAVAALQRKVTAALPRSLTETMHLPLVICGCSCVARQV